MPEWLIGMSVLNAGILIVGILMCLRALGAVELEIQAVRAFQADTLKLLVRELVAASAALRSPQAAGALVATARMQTLPDDWEPARSDNPSVEFTDDPTDNLPADAPSSISELVGSTKHCISGAAAFEQLAGHPQTLVVN